MNDKIVNANEEILLVGGGPLDDSDMIRTWSGPLIAADGGAAHCLDMGRSPDSVIGDMDSLGEDARAQLVSSKLLRIPEQDSTDFDKCLRNMDAPLVLGVGFLGGRIDHQLAAMTTLARHAAQPVILIGIEDVLCLLPPRIEMFLTPGTRLSLFPMMPLNASSTGLRWPLNGIGFSPTGTIGTSNEVTKPGEVMINADAPHMLLILPRACLGTLREALMRSARWPAAPA